MTKIIGIDLGSASIGWAVRDRDESKDKQIVKHGVVTFDAGMPKGKSGYFSPVKDRREARSKRRLYQAEKYRKWALLKILIENKMIPISNAELGVWKKEGKFPENEQFLSWLKCDFTYTGNNIKYKNPYELRVKALDEKVTADEFGRALYHIVQRRGYKDIGEKDKETKKQIDRRNEEGFAQALEENNYISKALKKEFLDKGKRARNEYPFRDEYKDELLAICVKQGISVKKSLPQKKDRIYRNDLNARYLECDYLATSFKESKRKYRQMHIGK